MARKAGLGPLGRRAIERAVQEANAAPQRTQIRTSPSAEIAQGNPAVTTAQSDERDTLPTNWWTPAKPSTRVQSAAYDPGSQRLYVLFVKPEPQGTPWTYEGVSQNEWRNFRRSASPGRYVNRILNGHNYHRGTWLD